MKSNAIINLDGMVYEFEPYDLTVSSDRNGYEFSMRAWSLTVKEEPVISKDEAINSFKDQSLGCGQINTHPRYPWDALPTQNPVPVKAPTLELYQEDLLTLSRLLDYVEELAVQDGVIDVEIRVKFDADNWAVLAYGEAGDPAIIRFEQ